MFTRASISGRFEVYRKRRIHGLLVLADFRRKFSGNRLQYSLNPSEELNDFKDFVDQYFVVLSVQRQWSLCRQYIID
jgi:hypothetical protein